MSGTSSMGLKLGYKNDTGSSAPTSGWNYVACVMDLDAGTAKKEIGEHKCLNAADRYVEKFAKFINAGTGTAEISYDKTQYAALKTLFDTVHKPIWWIIEIPDGDPDATPAVTNSTLTFKAILSEFGLKLPKDGEEVTDDLAFEIATKPTFTAGVAES